MKAKTQFISFLQAAEAHEHSGLIPKRFAKQKRSSQGSMLLFNLFAMFFLTVITLLISGYIEAIITYNHAQNAVQSSAICAAQELSKIVVPDQDWGYISLSDHPANGSITLAPDGESLPVLGINTVVNTVRLENIIAQRLCISEMQESELRDYESMRHAIANLQSKLNQLVRSSDFCGQDLNGKSIVPYHESLELFKTNMPELRNARATLRNFRISLGWLSGGSGTITSDPVTSKSNGNTGAAQLSSFTKYSAGRQDFYFAGVSERPRLVNSSRFQLADGKRICSAVMVEAELQIVDPWARDLNSKAGYVISVRAVALPNAQSDRCAPGSLLIDFPQGTIPDLPDLKSILKKAEFARAEVALKQSRNGDFPDDQQAQLETAQENSSVSRFQNRAFCDWLRSTHAKVRVDSLVAAMETNFEKQSRLEPCSFIFCVDNEQNCQVKFISSAAGIKRTVSDGQLFQYKDKVFSTSGGSLGVCIRDQVAHSSATNGGKHGGQPRPNELPGGIAGHSAALDLCSSTVRRSYLEGGLAVCMEYFLTN